MPKGWTQLNTVNDTPKSTLSQQEKNRKTTREDNFLRSIKSLSVEKLKEAGELNYIQHIFEEDALLDALESKRLKSKRLIDQALKIKKDRAKAEAKKKAAAASKEASDQKKDPEPAPAN